MNKDQTINLTLSYGDHSLRFAGPDLLDDTLIFDISGGVYDGDHLKIDSSYHPCCGTLEVNASLFGLYKRWSNKLDGCPQHQRDGGGDKVIKDLVWELDLQNRIDKLNKTQSEN